MWLFGKSNKPKNAVNDDTLKAVIEALKAVSDNLSDTQAKLDDVMMLWKRVGNRLDRQHYRQQPENDTQSGNGSDDDKLGDLMRRIYRGS